MTSRRVTLHGAVKHNYFCYRNNRGFAEFRYMFLPIRPSSGEVITKTYKEGGTSTVKDLSRSKRRRVNKKCSK
jgi:hypothetical protein